MDTEARLRLRRNLDAATDDALVALANRGIVRRAVKDRQQSGSFTVEETPQALRVHGDGWTVTMPADGPAAADDDTPATGVTRQIIAATLYLRDHWRPGEDGGDAGTEEGEGREDIAAGAVGEALQRLLDAPLAELAKWSGKTPLREAAMTVASVGDPSITYSPHLRVAFDSAGVAVFLMTDRPARTLRALLEQFKSSADKGEHRRWVMLAVLALKRGAGRDIGMDLDVEAERPDGAWEDRRRVGLRAAHLLRAMVASGIAHPSSRMVQRLQGLTVAAEAAYFPRLARLLAGIADDVRLRIARDAAFDTVRLMQRMVLTHALIEATLRPENAGRSDLFGPSRTQYVAVGTLELSGLGAYGWRTASGFEGLTVFFWEPRQQRFLSASVSRAYGQDPTFSPAKAYGSGIGWSGAPPIEVLCRHRLTLHDAKINAQGRLSLSAACRVSLGESTDPDTLDFAGRAVGRWTELLPLVWQTQAIGLRLPDPQDALVVVRPGHWGDRWFDELRQELVWSLYDDADDALEVRVPWTPVDETGIAFLESLKVQRDRPVALLGRLQVRDATVVLYPVAVFSQGTVQGDRILCPQFDQVRIRSRNEALLRRLRKKYSCQPLVETRIGDAQADEDGVMGWHDGAELPSLFRELLLDAEEVLTAILESGARRLDAEAIGVLSAVRDRLTALGVAPLADALAAVLHHSPCEPQDLLRAAYRLLLFRQTLALSRTFMQK